MDGTKERGAESPDPPAPLTLTVESATGLSSARSAIRRWLRDSLPAEDIDEVLLAGGEALANALEHGRAPITMSLEWSDDWLLQLRVRDSGAWRINPETTSRGLGIPIMTALMDSFSVDTTDGTAIQLSRQFRT